MNWNALVLKNSELQQRYKTTQITSESSLQCIFFPPSISEFQEFNAILNYSSTTILSA